MGVGKTTLGKALAHRLDYQFIDLDHWIQDQQGKTVAEIFAEVGEDGFRSVEQQALSEVIDMQNVVISTGGGTPCFFDNLQRMQNSGCVVYLKTAPQVLAERLYERRGKRPLIKDKTREELLTFIQEGIAHREKYYLQADTVFETDGLISRADTDVYVSRLLMLLSYELQKINK